MHSKTRATERPVRSGFVEAGDLEMYYEIDGEGPPVLLLHAGFLTIHSSFAELREPLRRQHRIIAFEQQGHGHTGDLDRPMRYEQMVEDTATALRKLDVGRADLFGWSDGGIVALGLAIEHPDLVRRVAIMGAGYSPDAEPPSFRETMRKLAPDEKRFAPMREEFERVAPDPDAWPTLIEKVKEMYFAFGGWDEQRLRSLAAPLMVMRGDRDFVTLEHAAKLQGLVPDGRLAVIPGSDHSAPVQHADWVAAMLLEFFAEADTRK